jgi:hypothetical protein
MMTPTQEQIDLALEYSDSEYGQDFAVSHTGTLAAAYRAEKARADLLERQYAEMLKQVSRADWDGWYDMLARHEAERKGQ